MNDNLQKKDSNEDILKQELSFDSRNYVDNLLLSENSYPWVHHILIRMVDKYGREKALKAIDEEWRKRGQLFRTHEFI